MNNYLFFDHASTTACYPEAAQLLARFAETDFGNPASSHAMGVSAAQAIQDSRKFFAETFNVTPAQVIFTGSGSEANNFAIYGVALARMAQAQTALVAPGHGPSRPRVLVSAIEHPAVRETALSLRDFGFDVQEIPVNPEGQIQEDALYSLLTPETVLVSIQQVNNIVGSILPVEALGRSIKARVPHAVFHVDAIQAFGRIAVPAAPSSVDLLSLSSHKLHGPKGVGALLILNAALLKDGLRPLIWGGGQEGGFRSGTQSPGLITAFRAAAQRALQDVAANHVQVARLRARLWDNLMGASQTEGFKFRWNSPSLADGSCPTHVVPHIISLSVAGLPGPLIAQALQERGCLVSTGSACSSQKKPVPDPVLTAMGVPTSAIQGAIRISLSGEQTEAQVDRLSSALQESVAQLGEMFGGAFGNRPA